MLRCNICRHVLRNCCAIGEPSYCSALLPRSCVFLASAFCIFCPWEIVAHCPCAVYLCILCAWAVQFLFTAHVGGICCTRCARYACLAQFVCLPCSCFAFLLRMCSVFVDLFCLLRAFVVHRLCVCCMFVVCLLCICCAYCMQLLCIWSAHVVHLLPRIARIRCVCCVLAAHLLLRIACIRAMFFFAGLLCVRCCVWVYCL